MIEQALQFKNGLHAATVRHLALRLSQAERSLQALTSGGIDAFVDPAGNTYLLRHEQERLRRNEARLQALFDTVPDVITVLTASGEVRYQSAAVTRVLGYDAGMLLRRSIFEFVHPDDLSEFRRGFSEAIQKPRQTTTIQFRHVARDGSWRAFEATLSSLPWGEVDEGIVLALRDVTSRREKENESNLQYAALNMACHAKDRVLAMLSHELRTPLTPALLGVTALEEDPRFVAARPTLAMIRRNIELESRLLEGLFDFTQITQGKLRLQLESVDAHEAVRNALEVCHSLISAKQIDVRLHLNAEEHWVRADAAKLQQIIWNLVKNAVKFSERGAVLSITSSADAQRRLTLAFTDHGMGIDARLLPIMFDAFQQGDPDRRTSEGMGLGLFIAKKFAEAQEGSLSAVSEGRGKGATFCLDLKIASPGEGGSPGKGVLPAAPAADSLRILLVEDHEDTRTALKQLLNRRGYIVFAAPDISAALAIAEACRIDLVISDIGLPDGTGYALFKKLRQAQPVSGISLSGFSGEASTSRDAGFSEHLVKPVDFETLHSTIRKVVRASRTDLFEPTDGATA